ncbi:MAG: carboxymuconolactone decarboxylase family protein [Gaiellaceae bacterium]
MAFIETVSDEEASGPVADLYEEDLRDQSYVTNLTPVFAHRPAAFRAWQQLSGAIRQTMDARRYELATLAAARRLKSSYCMLAHGSVLSERFFESARVRDLAVDHRTAGLDPVDVAVMDLAEKVAADATSVTESDVRRLRDLGLSDAEVVDVVLAAAARSFFSKVLDGLGAEPDAAYAALDAELRDSLTVGRQIAQSPDLESG